LDRHSKWLLVGSAALVALLGAVVAPYFLLDVVALSAICAVVAQQFLKKAEWPDWFPGRPVPARGRVMNYVRLAGRTKSPLRARRGDNAFEEALLAHPNPLALSDAELHGLATTKQEP